MSIESKFTPKTMRWIFWSLTMVLIVTVILCMIFYPEPYQFFRQTVSSLGEVWSNPGDLLSPVSQWIFTAGFTIMAAGSVLLIIVYIKVKTFYGRTAKVIVLFMLLLGCIGTACPADHPIGFIGKIHIVGAALFVSGFGLFNFMCQLLRYTRKHKVKPTDGKRKFDYYLDLTFVILTFVSVFWYLLSGLILDLLHLSDNWWLGPLSTEFSQKILLIVGCISAFLLDLDDM